MLQLLLLNCNFKSVHCTCQGSYSNVWDIRFLVFLLNFLVRWSPNFPVENTQFVIFQATMNSQNKFNIGTTGFIHFYVTKFRSDMHQILRTNWTSFRDLFYKFSGHGSNFLVFFWFSWLRFFPLVFLVFLDEYEPCSQYIMCLHIIIYVIQFHGHL